MKGIGAVNIELRPEVTTGTGEGCVPTPSVQMPSDFDPTDPCEAVKRDICPPRLARPTSYEAGIPDTSTEYEEQIVSEAVRRQRLMVFGILGAVLVGGGYLVYRTRRKG